MAKHDTDPVLRQLVHAINESEQAAVPVTVSAHGTLLHRCPDRRAQVLQRTRRGKPPDERAGAVLGPARQGIRQGDRGRVRSPPAHPDRPRPQRARSPRACGGSAWKPSTAGAWARTPRPAARTTAAPSPASSAPPDRPGRYTTMDIVVVRTTAMLHRRAGPGPGAGRDLAPGTPPRTRYSWVSGLRWPVSPPAWPRRGPGRRPGVRIRRSARRQQDRQAGQVEPEDQHDHAGERAVVSP